MRSEDLLAQVRDDLVRRGVTAPTSTEIAVSVRRVSAEAGPGAVLNIVDEVRNLAREFAGLGELAVPLADPEVTDVLLNGPGPVWIDRGRGIEHSGVTIPDAHRCREIAVRLATACGVRLDDSQPFAEGVLTELPPGVAAHAVRVHAVLDPPSGQGPCVSLRALSVEHRDFVALHSLGLFPVEVGHFLARMVACRASFVVSGGTGAGKTTFLAGVLSEVPSSERIILIEDTPELIPDHPHVVGLRTRDANADGAGEIAVRTLVRQSLRMRPDRIIVGEIRGAEIAELLLAFNTGHAGSAGTIHANGVESVPGRLVALGALAGLPEAAVVRQVIDGIQLVVHIDKTDRGRRITRIGRFVEHRKRLRVETVWDLGTGPGPGWSVLDERGAA